MKMYYDYWDDVDYELKEIKTRPCIPDDFQIDNESQNAKFFKADEKYLTEIKRNMKMEKIITIDLLLPDFQNIDPDDEERINERKKLIE